MSYLESIVRTLDVVYWDGDLQIRRRDAVETALIDIQCAVRPSIDYKVLWKDIAYNGMTDPIIIIPNSEKNYDLAIRQITPDLILPYEPNRPCLAYTGNQRIALAKWKNFSHISTIEMPDVHWAHAAHLKLQNGEVDCRDTRNIS
tara:strand:+ start:327 stop:761 length:435 start_codon:yes stop_codon:yes gene_type:complete